MDPADLFSQQDDLVLLAPGDVLFKEGERADAMFVLASGSVQEYRAEPGPADAVLPLEPGAETGWLLAEAARRLRVLACLPARHDRDRVVAAPPAAPGARLGGGQDEILALADGRRTPRDIAFALGRGVYATMLQLARMHQAGLLATVSPRTVPEQAGREPGTGSEQVAASGLPRRQQGLPAPPRRPHVPGRAPELRTPPGLLRPRPARGTGPGEAP